MKDMTYIALIPAYEPDEALLHVTEELFAAGFTLIIIDDGSGPAYSSIFKEAESCAFVLHHAKNRGKGCALRTGLKYIYDNFPEDSFVVTVDADGQHKPADAGRVIKAAEKNPGALILGSRHFTGKVPLRSLFGNTITRFVYRTASGVSLTDTQTGLRAFAAGMIPFLLSIEGDRYEYEMNVLLSFGKKKLPLEEVPIETVYRPGNSSSHFNTLRDSYLIYRDILKFTLSSLIGFAVDYSLFSILSAATGFLGALSIPLSNIAARIVSAGVNFTINKKFVFKSRGSALKTGAQYFLLASGVLAGNTALLTLLTEVLGINRYLAKLVTEITFFTASWLIQKFVIFREKENEEILSKQKKSEEITYLSKCMF